MCPKSYGLFRKLPILMTTQLANGVRHVRRRKVLERVRAQMSPAKMAFSSCGGTTSSSDQSRIARNRPLVSYLLIPERVASANIWERRYWLTDCITRPLCASAISTVTVPATLCVLLALSSPDLMSAINLSRANGGIASIGKLSIITFARIVEGHSTEVTLGPATGKLRIIPATAS